MRFIGCLFLGLGMFDVSAGIYIYKAIRSVAEL